MNLLKTILEILEFLLRQKLNSSDPTVHEQAKTLLAKTRVHSAGAVGEPAGTPEATEDEKLEA